MLDGKPIVVIATIGSENPKTGNMIQTWILKSDVVPFLATKDGSDYSICGDCPQRHFLSGSCYVQTFQGPRAVYEAYKRGNYSKKDHIKLATRALVTTPIRIGAYGDPCAVPFEVWASLLAKGCGRHTGYTHQWQRKDCDPRFKTIVMASCDSIADSEKARANGWRYFLMVNDKANMMLDKTVECLSDSKGITCEECSMCNGTIKNETAVSVAIMVHGARAKRFASMNVLR
jgi:hypothetical protein